jgi:hypothetical protein
MQLNESQQYAISSAAQHSMRSTFDAQCRMSISWRLRVHDVTLEVDSSSSHCRRYLSASFDLQRVLEDSK